MEATRRESPPGPSGEAEKATSSAGAAPPGKRAEAAPARDKRDEAEAALVERGRSFLYPNYQQPALILERGRGVELWDSAGRRYLDLCAGIAVSSLGHAHPALVSAISRQAEKLIHTSNYFFNHPNVELAERLCRLSKMDRVLFSNSGTEAIEAALKLCRHHYFLRGEKDRYRVIAFSGSFHGRTLGALAATGQPKYRDGFGPLGGVTHVPYGDVSAVEAALDRDVAAILVEPVQGEGGVVPAPTGFLAALRHLAQQYDVQLVLDEIQTGIGRTGRFLAAEHAGIEPDVVALAKGLGGGVPIGAMLCKAHLEKALPPGSHGSTFGGNPLASAAALAVLSTLEEQGLVSAAERLGDHLDRALQALVARHPEHVVGTRGLGLLRALVLREQVDARALLGRLRDAGVLLTLAGGSALRFSPPLVIERTDLDEGLAIVDGELSRL